MTEPSSSPSSSSQTSVRRAGHSRGLHEGRLPVWANAGDVVVLILLYLLFIGGFLHLGYRNDTTAWGAASLCCGLLGAWAATGLWIGRWGPPPMKQARYLLVFLGVVLGWTLLQQVPLPAMVVRAISPVWNQTFEAMEGSGLETPSAVPLAYAPEKAWRAWNELLASVFLLAAVLLVAQRRRSSRALIGLVVLSSLAEGVMAAWSYYHGTPDGRARGSFVNPNNTGTFIISGVPLALAYMQTWGEYHRRRGRGGLFSGTNPAIFALLPIIVAMLGWVATKSRASLFFGGTVLVCWIALEWLKSRGTQAAVKQEEAEEGSWESFARQLPSGRRHKKKRSFSFHPAVMASVLAVLLLGGATAFQLHQAQTRPEESPAGRLLLSYATLRGLPESYFLGYGLRGAEPVMNRFYTLPTEKAPVYSHNEYVQWFSELGVPGSVLALGALALFLRAQWRQMRSVARRYSWRVRLFQRAAWAGVVMTLLHSVVEFPLRLPLYSFHFLVMLAVAVQAGSIYALRSQRRG